MTQYLNRAVPLVIVVAIVIAAMLGLFGLWGMSEPGQVAMAILLIAATLWISEAVPLYVTSFLILAMTACLMSSIMSNTAAANLILPIVIGLQDVELPPLLVGVAFACSMAMALPISTPPNAIAFSSGELMVKDMVKPGLLMSFIGIALTGTVFFWWWKIVELY